MSGIDYAVLFGTLLAIAIYGWWKTRADHNLDQIGWKAVRRDAPATLDAFMHDYVDHLEHHLAQFFPRDTMAR